MPVAFTEEKQQQIYCELCEVAMKRLIDTSYQNIKVEQLTQAVGISKGAFYKFYPTKELFFYEILRLLHEELLASALEEMLVSDEITPDEAFCKALFACYDILQTSEYRRFWMEDSWEIMNRLPEEQKQEQYEAEKALLRKFLYRFGELAVDEDVAFDAIRTLITTAYNRNVLEPNYETILRWMAQGVCDHIFK